MQHIYNLAIIGAGPAGIATAIESYMHGIRDIILLEKDTNHNATIRKYYKDNKRVDKDWKGQKIELDGRIFFVDGTKESTLDFFEELLHKHSVELQTHHEVTNIEKQEHYFKISTPQKTINAKNVVITIGRMSKPNKPSYKIPSNLKKQISHTLDNIQKDEKVLVVGGGDSAIEYALDLTKENDITLCYRGKEFKKANPTNKKNILDALSSKKLKAILQTNIIELQEENKKIKVIFDNHESENFDKIIYALGGTTPSAFLAKIKIQEKNSQPLHDHNYETNIKGLFVAGDITQEKGGSIALGLNHGFKIATYIKKQKL